MISVVLSSEIGTLLTLQRGFSGATRCPIKDVLHRREPIVAAEVSSIDMALPKAEENSDGISNQTHSQKTWHFEQAHPAERFSQCPGLAPA